MNRYYIAPDGHGDDILWSRKSEDDLLPQVVTCRWRMSSEAWSLLVEAVNAREDA